MIIDRRTALSALAGLVLAPSFPTVARGGETASAREPQRSGDRIAMLLYPGMTALDLVGPYHFLGATGARVDLVTKGPDLSPVPSDLGLAIQPTATFATFPEDLTLLFVPGGTAGTIAAARDPETIAFVRDRGSRARYVTSVCTGSLILGVRPRAGRVVRDGKLITGAGVSAGSRSRPRSAGKARPRAFSSSRNMTRTRRFLAARPRPPGPRPWT